MTTNEIQENEAGSASVVASGPAVLLQQPRRKQPHFFARLLRNRLSTVGLAILLASVVLALLTPLLMDLQPRAISAQDALQGISSEHIMGTDNLGRDVFSRVVHGVRMSLLVAVLSVAAAGLVGIAIGLVSGYFGGWIDEVSMRIMDVLYAFPDLLLALALVATFGTGIDGLVIAIAIGRVPGLARITRASVLSIRSREYVEAAHSIGLRDWQIMLRHILPNGMAPIIVMVSISMAVAILAEASLSFLGLGIQPPTPSLGGLLKDALGFMGDAPWMAIFPGVSIAIIVFALNILGDGLRDLMDPRLR